MQIHYNSIDMALLIHGECSAHRSISIMECSSLDMVQRPINPIGLSRIVGERNGEKRDISGYFAEKTSVAFKKWRPLRSFNEVSFRRYLLSLHFKHFNKIFIKNALTIWLLLLYFNVTIRKNLRVKIHE